MHKIPKAMTILFVLLAISICSYMVFSNDSNMFGLSTTLQDDSEFNEAIENISNIENQSDIYMDSATNVSSIRASDFADIWRHCANDSKIENEMLRNLSNQTANQTLL